MNKYTLLILIFVLCYIFYKELIYQPYDPLGLSKSDRKKMETLFDISNKIKNKEQIKISGPLYIDGDLYVKDDIHKF